MAPKKLLSILLILIAATAAWLFIPQAPIFNHGTRIEAEAGKLKAPMKLVLDNNTSGGAYIKSTDGGKGTAEYRIQVEQPGIYKIKTRTRTSRSGDSFFFRIDDSRDLIWDVRSGRTNRWGNDDVAKRGTGSTSRAQFDPYTVELAAGTHTLRFTGREADTHLDYFTFELVKPIPAISFFARWNFDRMLNLAALLCLIGLSVITIIYFIANPELLRRKSSYETRINTLEKRFTDIQDVVISLDEQIKRLERQSQTDLELKV